MTPVRQPKRISMHQTGPRRSMAGGSILSGHTDVGAGWRGQACDNDPWTTGPGTRRLGNTLRFRGACDMKGFDALALLAMARTSETPAQGVPLQLAFFLRRAKSDCAAVVHLSRGDARTRFRSARRGHRSREPPMMRFRDRPQLAASSLTYYCTLRWLLRMHSSLPALRLERHHAGREKLNRTWANRAPQRRKTPRGHGHPRYGWSPFDPAFTHAPCRRIRGEHRPPTITAK